jgi:plastocyanin
VPPRVAAPAGRLVRIDTQDYAFVSLINGTRPAIDTIPAGAAITWIISPFDYEQHGVHSVGTPPFTGGDFAYASPLTVTFSAPGTYHYVDPYFETTGTAVVQ